MTSASIQPESEPKTEKKNRFQYLQLTSQDDKAKACHRQPSINVSEPGEVQNVF